MSCRKLTAQTCACHSGYLRWVISPLTEKSNHRVSWSCVHQLYGLWHVKGGESEVSSGEPLPVGCEDLGVGCPAVVTANCSSCQAPEDEEDSSPHLRRLIGKAKMHLLQFTLADSCYLSQ